MKLELKEKPKKDAVIIEGFSGLGLVGTIASEYLIDHLGARQIGKFTSDKIPAIVAIHEGEVIEPFAIFYDGKNNLIILRAIASVKGLEWELADAALQLSKEVGAREIIEIEGIGGNEGVKESKAYYFSNNSIVNKRFSELKINEIREGIIVGVTAALLSKMGDATFIFAEARSDLPDSRAAAKIIEVLDKYLGLKVDYKPLKEKAEKFESKVKDILSKSVAVSREKEQRESDAYIG